PATAWAAASIPRRVSARFDALYAAAPGFQRRATLVIVGRASLRISKRLASSWVVTISRPVRLPSGLERLATRPPATTSLARKTTGMVLVTALTALATRLPPAL